MTTFIVATRPPKPNDKPIEKLVVSPMDLALFDLEASVGAMKDHAENSKLRRAELAERELCINGETHGAPWKKYIRCQWCVFVHRYGLRAVLDMGRKAPKPPPGHVPRPRR